MGNICSSRPEALVSARQSLSPDDFESREINVHSFKVLRYLGKGSLGRVLLVSKRDTGAVYAMKVINKHKLTDTTRKKHAFNERQALASLKSEFIVTLHYAFQNSQKLYLVLDFMQGGDLFFHFQQQKKFSLDTVKFYTAEMVLALEDLHTHNIIYRDLKLENALLGLDGHLKLTDFNLAKLVYAEMPRTHTACGTPEYLSPEVLKGYFQTEKIDYWALGVLVYEMLEGVTPFHARAPSTLFRNILACKYTLRKGFPQDARALVRALLQPHPWDRPASLEEVKSHEFFNTIDWATLRARTGHAPITPKVATSLDLSYFENSNASASPEAKCAVGSAFEGFTYVSSPFIINKQYE